VAALKTVLLAGAGHAHAQVLLEWARAPLPGVQLVVVSPQALAPYSGMVPGWLAGLYRHEEIVIDFPALCAAAGARWVEDELSALDPERRRVHLARGDEIGYDLLSLNVGSTLTPPALQGAAVLAMRPLSALQPQYEALLARWVAEPAHQPFAVTAVGGGAAGVETLLAVLARLRALQPQRRVSGRLVAGSAALLPGFAGAAQRAGLQALQRAGATLQLGTRWCDSLAQRTDLLLWATGAQAQPWQRDPMRRGTLAVSDAGFVCIDAQLRSVSHPQVFAVGDCAAWQPPLPKAGVFAVRMGPVLAHNLRAALVQGGLRRYEPQRQFLALLSTADGLAIASRGAWAAQGRWAWWWKDHIDRRFVARFAQPRR
jgi:pyridine nucleotide-disulfide oxidoreductase family protein